MYVFSADGTPYPGVSNPVHCSFSYSISPTGLILMYIGSSNIKMMSIQEKSKSALVTFLSQ